MVAEWVARFVAERVTASETALKAARDRLAGRAGAEDCAFVGGKVAPLSRLAARSASHPASA